MQYFYNESRAFSLKVVISEMTVAPFTPSENYYTVTVGTEEDNVT